jgi:hypothetical protein
MKKILYKINDFLTSKGLRVQRVIHGSTYFIMTGEHHGIKCPLKNKNLKVAEIGVYKGYNSTELMKNLDIDHLYLIDPWEEYENNPMGDLKKPEQIARKRMAKYEGKVTIIKEYSDKVIFPFKLDYCYIDGDHSYEWVKKDLNNYFPYVKKSGILAGHDISIPDVLRAVQEFAKENNLYWFVCGDDWIIIKEDGE